MFIKSHSDAIFEYLINNVPVDVSVAFMVESKHKGLAHSLINVSLFNRVWFFDFMDTFSLEKLDALRFVVAFLVTIWEEDNSNCPDTVNILDERLKEIELEIAINKAMSEIEGDANA